MIGIPPIIDDLFDVIDELGGQVVYNEMPRQFAMVGYKEGLVEQYRQFTYPYDIFYRLECMNKDITERKLDGIIHYVQSFCPRQIDEISLRKNIPVPILTIESDRSGPIDERNRTRLEAFFERWQ